MRITRRAFLATLAVATLSACGGEQTATTEDSVVETEADEPSAQVFEGAAATVEYRDIQDSGGNAIISFMVTNKADSDLSGFFENVSVNGQFDIQQMGGIATPIQPGNSGVAQMVFGVPTQTTLSGVDELETLEADLVLYTDSPVEPVDTIHVSVTL